MKTISKLVSAFVILSLLVSIAGTTMAAPSLMPSGQATRVEPASISLSLEREKSATQTITVTTAATPIPKLDVMFVFDVTSSMRQVLNEAKTQGVYIMNTIRAQVADAAFGVASFSDYPKSYSAAGYSGIYGGAGDYPWQLAIDITSDVAAAQRGIESLGLHNGEDEAEDYSRALFEAMYVGWRAGAKRVVVLFGDSIPHDPNFFSSYGKNTGIDPGVDAVTETPDDLYFADVVAQVKSRNIQIIPVNSDLNNRNYVQAGFEYMALQTGGSVYPLRDAKRLPDVVIAGLTRAASVVSALSIVPDPGYENWIQVSPSSHSNVGGGQTRTFSVKITVPRDAEPGQYTFNLTASGDRATLGVSRVSVLVGGLALDAAKLQDEKFTLIQSLSTPRFMGTTPIYNCNLVPITELTYATEEQAVKGWLDSLDWNHLTPAQLGAIHRLTTQEDALLKLVQAQAQTSHIGNSQLAHVIQIVFSINSILGFLENLAGKSIVGLLVTKLKGYVQSKLIGLVVTVLEFTLRLLPPNATVKCVQGALKTSGAVVEDHFENALKKNQVTKEFLVDLVATVMVDPLDHLFNNLYIFRTQELVSRGLTSAKEAAQKPLSQSEVDAQAVVTAQDVAAHTDAVTGHQQSLGDMAKKAEEAQEALSLTSDLVALASTAATLTGIGALPAQIGHAIALALKLIDGLMASMLAATAYEAWWATGDAATNVTDAAYAVESMPSTSIALEWPYESQYASAMAHLGIDDFSPDLTLSDYTLSQLARVKADSMTYTDLLDKLADAIRVGDVKSAETMTDELLAADNVLNNTFLIARQPVLAGAVSVLMGGTPGFQSAYSDLGRAAAAFDGQGAILYVYLLGWFAEPANGESQQLLLDQIEVVKNSVKTYETKLTAARPYVESVAIQPSVLVTGYTLPPLQMGRTAILRVEVSNPTPTVAENVILAFDSEPSAKAASQSSFSLGALAGGAKTTVEIPFIPNQEHGLLGLNTSASNGGGAFRMIPFAVSVGGGGGAGLGMVVIVLALVVGAGSAVIITQRRRVVRPGMPVVPRATTRSRLYGLRGSWAGQVLDISPGGLTIGRGSGNTLRLEDRTVSRQHARIRYAQGQWFLQDLGSSAGTYVNGQRVQATKLSDGDIIRVGETEMQFRITQQG